jgi:hypothetical protein
VTLRRNVLLVGRVTILTVSHDCLSCQRSLSLVLSDIDDTDTNVVTVPNNGSPCPDDSATLESRDSESALFINLLSSSYLTKFTVH